MPRLPVSVWGDCGAAAGACASTSVGVPKVAATAIATNDLRICTLPVNDGSRSGIAASVPCEKTWGINYLNRDDAAAARTVSGRIARPRSNLVLADHFVGGEKKFLRDRNAKRLCSLAVDHQLESGRLLHRKIRRFRTFPDSRDVHAHASVIRTQALAVTHQTARVDKLARPVEVGHPVLRRKLHDRFLDVEHQRIVAEDE